MHFISPPPLQLAPAASISRVRFVATKKSFIDLCRYSVVGDSCWKMTRFQKKSETPNSEGGRSFEALITSLLDTRAKFLLGWIEISEKDAETVLGELPKI